MSHGIVSGEDVVLSVEGAEWHGLAKKMAQGLPVKKAAEMAGFHKWTTQLEPILHRNQALPDHRAAVRSDTGRVFGVVGAKWTAVQPMEQAEFAEELVKHCPGAYCSAIGTFWGGEDVAITVALPQEIKVGAHDRLKPYLLLSNNNAGRRALRSGFCATRTICNNTHQMALKELNGSFQVYLRHTKNVADRVKEAQQVLGLAAQAVNESKAEIEAMVAKLHKPVDSDRFFRMFAPHVEETPKKADAKTVEKIDRANVKNAELRKVWAGIAIKEAEQLKVPRSLWIDANALTNWAQHERNVKGEEQGSANRAWINMFGSGNDWTNRVLSKARELVSV